MFATNRFRGGAFALAVALASGCTITTVDDDDDAGVDTSGGDSEVEGGGAGGDDSGAAGEMSAPGAFNTDDGGASGDDQGDGDALGGAAGDDRAEEDGSMQGTGDGGMPDGSLGGPDGGDVDETDVEPGPVMSSTPIYDVAECGSIEPSELPASADRDNPTVFEVGQLVGGRIDPDSTTNQEHYWEVELAQGFYHVVLDSESADGDRDNLGLSVHRLDASGAELNHLLRGSELAQRYRDALFLEVETDGIWRLRVTPRHDMEDYFLGIFPNGTAVPSPRFADCPTVTELTLGEAASFTLGARETAGDSRWFAVDLDIADYTFSVEAIQAGGEDTNLQHELHVLDRFGQEPRAEQVLRVNEIDTSHVAEGMLAVGEAGLRYVRLTNNHDELEVTLTVSEQ